MKQNCKNFLLWQHRNAHETSQTLIKRPTGSLEAKRGVEGQIWCEMGEGVFIGPKSSGCPVLKGVRPVLFYSGPKAVSYV